MQSTATEMGTINLPIVDGEYSMIPFDMETLEGLPEHFKAIAGRMLENIKQRTGIAHFTIHGKALKATETLRRGAPHTDGSYDRSVMDWTSSGGGNGWKIGEDGPAINSPEHARLYNVPTGGIILASNHAACLGWIGEYDGLPNTGGDCSHLDLDEPFMLKPDTIYYGNNHFIHESLPVQEDVHRVFARITLPEDHRYEH